jgi:hypothetical protein
MGTLSKKLRAIAIDVLGVMMLIGALLFGWLPGPGGIPLLVGGLALLSINHTWAKRLLERVKKDGESLMGIIFRDHPIIKLAFDLLSVVLVIGATFLLYQTDRNLLQSLAIILLAIALGLFLGNRKRLERIIKKIQKK